MSPKPPSPAAPVKKRRLGCWLVLLLIVIPAILVGGYAWVALKFSYSDGERAGFVQKISRRGWICKTWEGELALASVPGSAPQIFLFTVRDEKVARDIERAAGQRVALTYEQHKGLPTDCFGDTEYWVTGVRVLNQ